MDITRKLTVGLVLGLALSAPGAVLAQGHMGQGQQMGQMQQQMQRMQQMMQRMDQMQTRIHQMDQTMSQQMDQLRARDKAAAQDGAGERDRIQARIMEQERLRDMLGSTGEMVGQMGRSMDQLRGMMGDQAFQGDQVMQRHMEQLQERFQNMADRTDECLQLMEQMQQRLHERISQPSDGTS